MPINRPTNTHGQGYSDLNFLMPELTSGLDYTKGPYYASVGDFGSVVSTHLHLANDIPNQVSVTGGMYGIYTVFGGGTLRYVHGSEADGYSGTMMYFHSEGRLITDQPLRAIEEGLIDRFGTLDPTGGIKDFQVHPLEPITATLRVSAYFREDARG
jgi:hypothetical protein